MLLHAKIPRISPYRLIRSFLGALNVHALVAGNMVGYVGEWTARGSREGVRGWVLVAGHHGGVRRVYRRHVGRRVSPGF